jgi:hypothetical protein
MSSWHDLSFAAQQCSGNLGSEFGRKRVGNFTCSGVCFAPPYRRRCLPRRGNGSLASLPSPPAVRRARNFTPQRRHRHTVRMFLEWFGSRMANFLVNQRERHSSAFPGIINAQVPECDPAPEIRLLLLMSSYIHRVIFVVERTSSFVMNATSFRWSEPRRPSRDLPAIPDPKSDVKQIPPFSTNNRPIHR